MTPFASCGRIRRKRSFCDVALNPQVRGNKGVRMTSGMIYYRA